MSKNLRSLFGGKSKNCKECSKRIHDPDSGGGSYGCCKCDTFEFGDFVRKVGGDYRFDGTVVSVFRKLSGKTRYVVEDDRGVLHIYSKKNLEKDPE